MRLIRSLLVAAFLLGLTSPIAAQVPCAARPWGEWTAWQSIIVVHGVQFGPKELIRLKSRSATLVTCPRGNRLTAAGEPPVADFYASGVRIAVGTDSLASVPDLNMFSELAELRRLAPQVPAARQLESATINGAAALGFDGDYGTIEPGKRDALIAVDVPANL